MSILKKLMDERFFAYRQRSTSIAGIVGAVLAVCLFEYRFFVKHVWDWNVLAIALAFVGTKPALMTWYYLTD